MPTSFTEAFEQAEISAKEAIERAHVAALIEDKVRFYEKVRERAETTLRPWMVRPDKFAELDAPPGAFALKPPRPRYVIEEMATKVMGRSHRLQRARAEDAVATALLFYCDCDPDHFDDERSFVQMVIDRAVNVAKERRGNSLHPGLSLDAFPGADAAGHGAPIEGGVPPSEETKTHAEFGVKSRANETWPADRVLGAFKRFYLEHGRPPKAVEAKTCSYLPSTAPVYRHFNSWTDACTAAGMEAYGSHLRSTKWQPFESAQVLRSLATELGYWPNGYQLETARRANGRTRLLPTTLAVKRLLGLRQTWKPLELQTWAEDVLAEAAAPAPDEQVADVPDIESVPFKIHFADWFVDGVDDLSVTTAREYASLLKVYAMSILAKKPVDEVIEWDIRRVLKAARDEGIAAQRLEALRAALTHCFAYAVRVDRAVENVARSAVLPKPLSPAEPTEPEEAESLMVTPDQILDVLTTGLTAQDVAYRLNATNRETVPVLNDLVRDGSAKSTVAMNSLVRYSPVSAGAVVDLPVRPVEAYYSTTSAA